MFLQQPVGGFLDGRQHVFVAQQIGYTQIQIASLAGTQNFAGAA